ncbi:MAG TPA: SLC13 family permease [Candidatus Brocadiia bacterium]
MKPYIVLGIFSVTYILIVIELLPRTSVALMGAAIMICAKFVSYNDAIFKFVDYNTIILLTGMMIIVGVIKETGIFEYTAVKLIRLSKADPWRMLILFALFTAFASAFLDNVTTVLLLVPISISVTKILNVDPIPFLIAVILSANIGGTATLIGDPPNILVSGAANFSFNDFIKNLTPIVVVVLIVSLIMLRLLFIKSLSRAEDYKAVIMNLNETGMIKDKGLLIKSLIVLGLTLIGFITYNHLGIEEPSIVAITGAALLLIVTKKNPEKVLSHYIEWTSLFFFIGLFILVGSLKDVGMIERVSHLITAMTESPLLLAILILWVSAIASAFLGSVPATALLITLVAHVKDCGCSLSLCLPDAQAAPIWWAMALGACLGGNFTIISAACNVVVSEMAKKANINFSFGKYLRYGIPVTIMTLLLSTVYIYFRYF